MKISDYLISLIRTFTPLAVGSVLGWLSGVTWLHDLVKDLTLDQRVAITTAVTGLFVGVYYAVVRKLEPKYPWLGKLLGYAVASLQYGKLPDPVVHVPEHAAAAPLVEGTAAPEQTATLPPAVPPVDTTPTTGA